MPEQARGTCLECASGEHIPFDFNTRTLWSGGTRERDHFQRALMDQIRRDPNPAWRNAEFVGWSLGGKDNPELVATLSLRKVVGRYPLVSPELAAWKLKLDLNPNSGADSSGARMLGGIAFVRMRTVGSPNVGGGRYPVADIIIAPYPDLALKVA